MYYVLLHSAHLELKVKSKLKYSKVELLNWDDHQSAQMKATCRPDILHHSVLQLLDSPLNHSNLLRVYISTQDHQLIELNEKTRLPRTFKRFCGLMCQLLQKMSIKSTQNDTLLRIVKNPITRHMPANTRYVVLSDKGQIHRVDEFLNELKEKEIKEGEDMNICFIVGAIPHGDDVYLVDGLDISDYKLSMSEFPLSAALSCAKLAEGIERYENIL
eukprot:NODE_160_length_16633_cov_0.230132.p9 type:complete len:216 gc:universal NODE_160_length_16633_cov_0.230132:2896-2249(-)